MQTLPFRTRRYFDCSPTLLLLLHSLCAYSFTSQMKTALHLACIHEHNEVALELASHDQSTLDAFDSVSVGF